MAGASSLLSLVLLLPAFVHAANDWSKPCFEGTCSWDVVNGTSATGGMTLSGSSNAISDITTAAGWELVSCQTTGTTSTVRIVCSSDDTAAAGCDHLEQSGGAENKLVRLPAGCGYAPFARVASLQVAQDQTLPASLQRRLHRRANTPPPQVKQLALDINWSAVPVSKNGAVNLYITGANVPGAQDIHNTAVTTATRRRAGRAVERRGFFSSAFGAIGSAIKGAADDVGDAVKDVAGDVESAATKAVSAVVSVATNAVDDAEAIATKAASAVVSVATKVASAAESIDSFNESKTFNLPPVNFNKDFTLINKTFGCGEFTADLAVSGSAAANAAISVGVVAVGTIIPPKLTQFQAQIGGNADFDGSLTVKAGVKGEFSTGTVQIVPPIGITPFEIPGIFTLGPSVELTGQINGDLDLSFDMTASLSYSSKNLQIFIPPQNGQTSSSNTNLNSAPLKLSVSPGIEAAGSVTGHLTPTVLLGLNAFDNLVQADLFVDFDAAVELSAQGDASTSISKGAGSVASQAKNNLAFAGSVAVEIPLSFNAGAKGDFFGLLNLNKNIVLFEHTFDVFSKTFGNGKKRAVDARAPEPAALSSIHQRELERLAARAAADAVYNKRGPRALLAGRESSACPAEDQTSDLDEVADTTGDDGDDSE